MKITRNINLHGAVITIDEDAYQALKAYLEDIESRLPQDEQRDVMDDLESRIAELLRDALFIKKVDSVTLDMIVDIKARIGSPDEFGENKRPTIKRAPVTRQGVGRVLTIILKVILIIIAIQLLFPVLAAIFGIAMGLFGISIGGMALIPAIGFTLLGGSTAWTWLLVLSIILALAMPIYMIVHWIVKWSRERQHPSLRFWVITLLIWLLSIGGLVASGVHMVKVNDPSLPAIMTTLEELEELDEEDFVIDEE